MSRPTLSLLIPAYNAASFLPRLLKSAHAQTEPFDEIWVYDDCSTDNTAAVAEAHGAKVLRGTVNKGCSAGKNALAQHVETDWMHFHDADDELLPHFVELASSWMTRAAHDVVLFDYEYRDDETRELLSTRHFDPKAIQEDARRYALAEQINPFCGLYSRRAYLAAGGYDEDPAVLYNEDVAFHIRMAFAGLRFGAENTVSVINYRRAGSMSAANALKCDHAHFHVMAKALKIDVENDYAAEIGGNLWALAGRLAALGDWAMANSALTLARQLTPPPAKAGSVLFRTTAAFWPMGALRAREAWIRAAKPQLRMPAPKH
jgi:glycosyltransferase involved in cell wall biosynthesis